MALITSSNFDAKFKRLLRLKKGEHVIRARFDIENIRVEEKIIFILQMLTSIKTPIGVVYKLLFWESDNKILDLISSYRLTNYHIASQYKNRTRPGVLFIESNEILAKLISMLLTNHFNYELAEEPAINIRLQVCINTVQNIQLFDFYDDRGFDAYYIELPK